MARPARNARYSFLSGVSFLAWSVVAAAAYAADLPSVDRVLISNQPKKIADAEFVDQDGDNFKLSTLQGKPALVFFGFTNCPDVCPAAMALMKQIEASENLDSSLISFVLISVDGERDTAPVLKEFLGQYSEQFIGLTKNPQDVQSIARQFRAPFYKTTIAANDPNYMVAHSSQIFLLDSRLRIRAELHNPAADDAVKLIGALLDEE